MKKRLLSWLKLRERPDPPPGSGASVAVFRASRRHLYYSALSWLPKQVATLAGLLLGLAFFGTLDQPFLRAEGFLRFLEILEGIRFDFGPWTLNPRMLIDLFELLAVAGYVAQFLFTGLLLKLGWELRWYVVGDDFLRIREGLWVVREQTIRLANVQNLDVRQGPIQKLFGIADLEVHTAGGGAPAEADDGGGEKKKQDLHVARFRGLADARGLRDRIRELVRHRDAGLGEAEEAAAVESEAPAAAVHDLLEEARALRRAAVALSRRRLV